VKTILPSRPLPRNTRARVQHLLDEADTAWFERYPGEQYRIRMHFRGERLEGDAENSRHVRVEREGARLVRRFTREGATA